MEGADIVQWWTTEFSAGHEVQTLLVKRTVDARRKLQTLNSITWCTLLRGDLLTDHVVKLRNTNPTEGQYLPPKPEISHTTSALGST